MYCRYISGIVLNRFYSKPCFNVTKNNYVNGTFFNKRPRTDIFSELKCFRYRIGLLLQKQSIQVIRTGTKQCEFIIAQRIRQSFQIFHLYSKLWEAVALQRLLRVWIAKVFRNTAEFLIAAVSVSLFDWEKEKIPASEMYSYIQEFDLIHQLQESTIMCNQCKLRLIIDCTQPEIDYCQCKDGRYTFKTDLDTQWEPFIERQDMVIWRKEESDTGLYAYKVHGLFADVSAEDFLQVQIDIEYRKEWDATVKELKIIDTDERLLNIESEGNANGRSDVIYWEMIWPRMFTNRDYVYQRRWIHDRSRNIIIIVSKGTNHPNAPIRPDAQRVTTYWSYMVIKPFNNFHESGIEFSLTYFDDPGINIPSAVTTWVAISGLPDFLSRMREAGRNYKRFRASRKSAKRHHSTNMDTLDPPNDVGINNNKNTDEGRPKPSDGGAKNQNFQDMSQSRKSRRVKNSPSRRGEGGDGDESDSKENHDSNSSEKNNSFFYNFFSHSSLKSNMNQVYSYLFLTPPLFNSLHL